MKGGKLKQTGQTRTIMLLGQTCFVNGLSDERIRTQMSVFMDTQPTMKETVDEALICETNVKSQAIQPQVLNRFNKIGNYKFQQNKNVSSTSNIKGESVNQITKKPFVITCYQCGKTGHMKRQCRVKCMHCNKIGHTAENRQ